MQVEKSSLKKIALEISISFDALLLSCTSFHQLVTELLEEEQKECCQEVLANLIAGMKIANFQLCALAEIFRSLNLHKAAEEQAVENALRRQEN